MSRITEVDIENIKKSNKRNAKVRAVAEDIYELVDNTQDRLSGIEAVEEYLLNNVL